jgi:hypothetical protein
MNGFSQLKIDVHWKRWSRGDALDLYSGGAQFESRSRHRQYDWGFSLYSSVILSTYRNSTWIIPLPSPSKFFPIHHSSIILLSYTVQSRYWKAWTNGCFQCRISVNIVVRVSEISGDQLAGWATNSFPTRTVLYKGKSYPCSRPWRPIRLWDV